MERVTQKTMTLSMLRMTHTETIYQNFQHSFDYCVITHSGSNIGYLSSCSSAFSCLMTRKSLRKFFSILTDIAVAVGGECWSITLTASVRLI